MFVSVWNSVEFFFFIEIVFSIDHLKERKQQIMLSSPDPEYNLSFYYLGFLWVISLMFIVLSLWIIYVL